MTSAGRYRTDPVYREAIKARTKAWRLAHPGRASELVAAWCAAHPERRREIARLSARRRAAAKTCA